MKAMRKIAHNLYDDQRGASAVEFAIIMPLLVVFVFGIIEFSILFYDKAVVTNASREGARAGIVFSDPRLTDPEIRDVIYNYLDAKPDGTDPRRLITFGPGVISIPPITQCTDPGDELSVKVTYQYDFLLLPNILAIPIFDAQQGGVPGSINIVAVTKMRCE
jgi:Flp pilus assembly pilin Flp